MAKMLDTVLTHTHTLCNLINKNTNTQYICVFNNNININVWTKMVGTRLIHTTFAH